MATQRPGGLVLSAHLAGPGAIATRETVLPPGDRLVPGADPGARRRVLVRAGDPRPVRRHRRPGIRGSEPLILPLHDDQAAAAAGRAPPARGRPGSGPTSTRCRGT